MICVFFLLTVLQIKSLIYFTKQRTKYGFNNYWYLISLGKKNLPVYLKNITSTSLTSSWVEKIVLEYMCKQVIIIFFFSKKKVSWSNVSWNYMHLCKPGGFFFKQNCYNDQMVKLYLLLSFAFVRHTNLCIFICNIRLTYLKRIFWRYKSIMHKTKAMNIELNLILTRQ
jgi:hypothetical protein